MIAGRSVLRENDADPGRQHARSAPSNTTVIGNLQWRFTPSAQVHDLAAGLRAQGRLPQSGDRRPHARRGRRPRPDLAGQRGSGIRRPRPPHRVRRAGAVARCRAHRSPLHEHRSEHCCSMTTGDAWSAAGWAQYRWTPTARLLDHARRARRALGSSIDQTEGVAVAVDRVRSALGHARCGSAPAFSTRRRRSINAIFTLPDTQLVPERARDDRGRPRAALRIGLARRRHGLSPPR